MLTDDELQYFYFGFYRILKRYRSTSLLGWTIVLAGCLSIPFGWNLGRTTGFIDVILTLLTILAGLALVWQNISALDEYIRVPFHSSFDSISTKRNEIITDIRTLMKEVDDGGWREAYEALSRLSVLQAKYDLPKLE